MKVNEVFSYIGIDSAIRCALCTNPIRSDTNCDGNCRYNNSDYEKIMQELQKLGNIELEIGIIGNQSRN